MTGSACKRGTLFYICLKGGRSRKGGHFRWTGNKAGGFISRFFLCFFRGVFWVCFSRGKARKVEPKWVPKGREIVPKS